jgi:prefoldin subunit 1
MDRLAAESVELKSDMSGLEKKLHYLETSKENLDQILNSAGGS